MTRSKIIMYNLRDLFRYTGMKQKEFADMIGSSEASVSKYLSGERSPSVMTIIKICEAFLPSHRMISYLRMELKRKLSLSSWMLNNL